MSGETTTNVTDEPRIKAPRTRLHPDVRRHDLIRTAYMTIATKGFEGLRTRDVAATAGVNQATLHHYFPDKESLIRGVVAYALEQFIAQARAHTAAGPPLDQLRGEFIAARNTLRTHPELETVLYELMTRAARDTTVRAALGEMDRAWHAGIVDILADGIADGTFRANLDPIVTATMVIALLRGLRLQWFLAPEMAHFDAAFGEIERLLTEG